MAAGDTRIDGTLVEPVPNGGAVTVSLRPERVQIRAAGHTIDGQPGCRLAGSLREIIYELGLAPDHALVTQVGIRSWRGNDDVLEAMARDKECLVVMTLAGAMTVAKQGLIIADLIDRGIVNAVVSTGALMAHGLSEAIGMVHYRHDAHIIDIRLPAGIKRLVWFVDHWAPSVARPAGLQEMELPYGRFLYVLPIDRRPIGYAGYTLVRDR